MDWSSELCVRSLKRRRNGEYLPDQVAKVSRLSLPSRVSGAHHWTHQDEQGAAHCDFSDFASKSDAFQLILQSDTQNTCSSKYTLPVNRVISKSAHSDMKPNQTVPERERSLKDLNTADTVVIAQSNQQNYHKLNTSMIIPSEQVVHKNIQSFSNDRGCPDCAAGQSGHIRHIGRWRLMDSV